MLLVHIGLFLAVWFASFLTRWDFQPDAPMVAMFRATVVWVVVVKTIVFLLHDQFRWRFGRLSFADLGRLAFTTTLATLTRSTSSGRPSECSPDSGRGSPGA